MFFIILLSSCYSKVSHHEVDDPQCRYKDLPIAIKDPDDLTIEVMQAWNDELGLTIFKESRRGIKIVYLDIEEGKNGITYFNCSEDGFKTHADIEIEASLSDNKAVSVIAHELGHVIGMQHTEYGIMRSPVPIGNINENIAMMNDYFYEIYPDYVY